VAAALCAAEGPDRPHPPSKQTMAMVAKGTRDLMNSGLGPIIPPLAKPRDHTTLQTMSESDNRGLLLCRWHRLPVLTSCVSAAGLLGAPRAAP
jgi:hypothetical protein